MLLNVTILWTIVLSALIWSAEEDVEPKTFVSVFETIYWCIVTQTTLGYGDINVVTPIGRLLACITTIIGIINLAFMINLMSSCFEEAYTRFLAKEEYEFKLRLEAEMRKETVQKFCELHQIHDEAQCRRVRPRILSIVREEGD